MQKDQEDVEELIALDKEQSKAFRRLQKAVKDCDKLNVLFYQNLDHLYGLNGNNVKEIVGTEETNYDCNGSRNTNNYWFPCADIVCSFADDPHHIIFHDD